MKKRLLTALLLLLCTSLLLTACGEGEGPDGSDSDTLPAGAASEEETKPQAPDLSEFDLNGKTFSILYRFGSDSYNVEDVAAEKLTSEPVNDAVYTRNRMMEDNLGIRTSFTPDTDPAGKLRNLSMSGDDDFDAATDRMNTLFPMSSTGAFVNWRSVNAYDPDEVWWDSNADESLSIGNVLFIAVGDCSMKASSCARFIYYNKAICDKYNMPLPYQDVRNGTWTLDTFIGMMSQVAEDLNGDGKMNSYDRFGLLSETNTFFVSGCDVPFTEKDEDGIPVLAFMNERTPDVVDKVNLIMNDKAHTLSYQDASSGRDISGYAHLFEFGRSLFANGQFLFVQNGASEAYMFVDMEDPYGVLPNPKYDAAQPGYHHLMDPFACAWVMPASVKDPEKSAALMSYWCYLSTDTLVEAFYETTIKFKRLNAPEDAEMMDIIRATIRYEISTLDSNNIMNVLAGASSGSGLASSFKRSEKTITRQLENMAKKFEKFQ
ncbi:MAG: hypothetical protein MJ192_07690 [Clostridia bacterium]|nr:hypothetical protein [Clostridia bacterium]